MNITIDLNIKLNEEIILDSNTKMEYYNMYLQQEMSKGTSEFHSTIKFLMDETVPQKYKDYYRKKQNQVTEAMDLDEEYIPDPPKLTRQNAVPISNVRFR
jgi:hypothetical protein